MLSLKHSLPHHLSRSTKALIDLPSEILDLILYHVYHGSGGYVSSIFPVSRTCRQLRTITYPILFEKLSVRANEDVIEKRSWLLLQNLLSCPHLMRHVRTLEIQTAIEPEHPQVTTEIASARMGQRISRSRLTQCLGLMSGLRYLQLHYISEMIFDVLKQLCSDVPIHISFNLRHAEKRLSRLQMQRLQQILASSFHWTCFFSLPLSKSVKDPQDVAQLCVASNTGAIDWADNWTAVKILGAEQRCFPHLEELHISSQILAAEDYLLAPGFVSWRTLRRLHVEGDRQIQQLLASVVKELTGLQDLRLHASTTNAFHEECLDMSRRPPLNDLLPFNQMHSLEHLSLRGICPHYHVRQLTTPTLKSLALVLPEYHARLRSFTEARHPSEIRWLAQNLPHLQHLELHIGPLENLWHPTAIAGVDVDVEVYTALQSLTQIPHLKTLRLFPPYVPRNAGHDYLNARQPLSDEQAIRVFRHLHGQQPGLQTLSIAATFYMLRGFSPMSWLVRDGGNSRTVLTTRQAGKNYELEQLWFGQRRNSMKNRRHTSRKPYLKDMRDGWVFSVDDPAV